MAAFIVRPELRQFPCGYIAQLTLSVCDPPQHTLGAWRETPFFSSRERAALAWTEALTLISETHAPDDVFEELRAHFTEREIADLTLAISAINAWNRFAISFRVEIGTYQPGKHAASGAAARH